MNETPEEQLGVLDQLEAQMMSEEKSRSKAIEQLNEPKDIRHSTDLISELCVKNSLLVKIGDEMDDLGGEILKSFVDELEHRLISKERSGRKETVDVIRASRDFEMMSLRQKAGMMLGGGLR